MVEGDYLAEVVMVWIGVGSFPYYVFVGGKVVVV